MKYYSIFFLSVLFVLPFYSCSKIEVRQLKFNLNEISSIHKSDVISDVEIYSLQDSTVTLGSIEKVELLDSIIYLQDMSTNSLHIFSLEGNHINTISGQGHGNGEYYQLNDFFVDNDNKTVNLLSRLNKKIYVYDLLGRKLLNQIELPKAFVSICKSQNNYIGYMGNYTENADYPYNYWIMDKSFNVKGNFGKINQNIESHCSRSFMPFSFFKDNLNVIYEYSNSVKTISPSNAHEINLYELDFGEYNCPVLTKSDFNDNNRMFKVKNTYITNPNRCQETEHYLLFFVNAKGQNVICAYNKNGTDTHALQLDSYTDKYLFGFGNIVGVTEKHIISTVDAEEIYDCWIGRNDYNDFYADYPTQVENLRKRFKNVDPSGNPFLIVYNLN
ncbi:MAG: 6-bladed beta-propeller [Bacteroidaceae bacterium]|nr:6-bladed beta-propeller [Bacteroidaceae bacterium]